MFTRALSLLRYAVWTLWAIGILALCSLWIHGVSYHATVALPLNADGEWGVEWSEGDVELAVNPGPTHGGELAPDRLVGGFGYTQFQPERFHQTYLQSTWGTSGPLGSV